MRDVIRILWVGLALGAALTSSQSCSAARSVVIDVDPTTPARATCQRGTWRCNGLVPEHCDDDEADAGVTRWWPSNSLASVDGGAPRPAPCAARCVVDGDPAVAHCAGAL